MKGEGLEGNKLACKWERRDSYQAISQTDEESSRDSVNVLEPRRGKQERSGFPREHRPEQSAASSAKKIRRQVNSVQVLLQALELVPRDKKLRLRPPFYATAATDFEAHQFAANDNQDVAASGRHYTESLRRARRRSHRSK